MHLVTYNIQYGTGKDRCVDLDRIVAEIASADIIAMQEVDRYWSRSNLTDQVAEITNRLPNYYWVYGPGIDLNASTKEADGCLINKRRQFGNLLLSKYPILASKNYLLPKMNFHSQLTSLLFSNRILRDFWPWTSLSHSAAASRVAELPAPVPRGRRAVDGFAC